MPVRTKHKRLSQQRRRFCDLYFSMGMKRGDGEKAAIQADYSTTNARQRAHQLLQRDEVREYLQRLQDNQRKRFEVTADNLIQEMAAIAFANSQDYFEVLSKGSTPTAVRRHLSRELAAAVQTIEMSGKKIIKLKLHDKQVAQANLAKILGITQENINVNNKSMNVPTIDDLGLPLKIKKAVLKAYRVWMKKQGAVSDGS